MVQKKNIFFSAFFSFYYSWYKFTKKNNIQVNSKKRICGFFELFYFKGIW